MNHRCGLVIGSSGGIGLGFVEQLLNDPTISKICGVYRNPKSSERLLYLQQINPDKLTLLQGDVTQEKDIINLVNQINNYTDKIHLMINCVGMLHQENIEPEKSLKHIESDKLLRYFQVNAVPSVLLAKHLLPFFKHQDSSVFASISAKVGSIEDNYLGGWYGYRASKSALNMFIKNIAIEYNRVSKNTIVVALHPGTTDTKLSQPFQSNVPPEKLFSVERCTTQLLSVINSLTKKDHGKFFSWDGTVLPW